MNFKSYKALLFITVSVFLMVLDGCDNNVKVSRISSNIRSSDDTVVNFNREVVKTENQEIEDFIKRYGWKMEETTTGLRFKIYHLGKGPKALIGQLLRINYSVKLLTGEEIYSSKKSGSKEFIVGTGKMESGIEEGILMLREGDRAKFIVPSHLAYGLLGDMDKIPERAVLVYDLEVVKISATRNSPR